jgi:hypothetical protein
MKKMLKNVFKCVIGVNILKLFPKINLTFLPMNCPNGEDKTKPRVIVVKRGYCWCQRL